MRGIFFHPLSLPFAILFLLSFSSSFSSFFEREREFGRLFNRKEGGKKIAEGKTQEESGKRADRMEFHAPFLFFLSSLQLLSFSFSSLLYFSFSSLFSLLLLIFLLLSPFSLNETMNRLFLPSYFSFLWLNLFEGERNRKKEKER